MCHLICMNAYGILLIDTLLTLLRVILRILPEREISVYLIGS